MSGKPKQLILPMGRVHNLTKNPISTYTFNGDILIIPSASIEHTVLDNSHYYIVDEIPPQTTLHKFIKVLWTGKGRGDKTISGLALYEQPDIRVYLMGE